MNLAILILAAWMPLSPARAESRLALLPSGASPDASDAAELYMKGWLARQPAIRKALSRAATGPETDLRDAPGPKNSPRALSRAASEANPKERLALIQQLPGFRTSRFGSCRNLLHCAEPPSAFHLQDLDLAGDAIVALIRPWRLLQNARGKELKLLPSRLGDRILTLQLDGLPGAELEVHMAPTGAGAVNLWLHGRSDPASLFSSERRAILASAK